MVSIKHAATSEFICSSNILINYTIRGTVEPKIYDYAVAELDICWRDGTVRWGNFDSRGNFDNKLG